MDSDKNNTAVSTDAYHMMTTPSLLSKKIHNLTYIPSSESTPVKK